MSMLSEVSRQRGSGGVLNLLAAVTCLILLSFDPSGVTAATIRPPMYDIIRQCDQVSHRNATAMSECVVAESETRADLLQRWSKLDDASVSKCMKSSRKIRHSTYAALAKCLTVPDPTSHPAPTSKPETAAH
jgi:hypothetical protein